MCYFLKLNGKYSRVGIFMGRFNNSSLLFAQGKTTLPTEGASVNCGIHLVQTLLTSYNVHFASYNIGKKYII
jgi:hypothetical protein